VYRSPSRMEIERTRFGSFAVTSRPGPISPTRFP
jgi:hypothetical protein